MHLQTYHGIQAFFIFSLVWTIGSTMNNNSRRLFDDFYRNLLNVGTENHPKPKSFKLSKQQLFPEVGLVYDYMFNHSNGSWINWLNTLSKEEMQLSEDCRVGYAFVIILQFFFQ